MESMEELRIKSRCGSFSSRPTITDFFFRKIFVKMVGGVGWYLFIFLVKIISSLKLKSCIID